MHISACYTAGNKPVIDSMEVLICTTKHRQLEIGVRIIKRRFLLESKGGSQKQARTRWIPKTKVYSNASLMIIFNSALECAAIHSLSTFSSCLTNLQGC